MRRLLSHFEPKRALAIELFDALEYLDVIGYYVLVFSYLLVTRPYIFSDECTLVSV